MRATNDGGGFQISGSRQSAVESLGLAQRFVWQTAVEHSDADDKKTDGQRGRGRERERDANTVRARPAYRPFHISSIRSPLHWNSGSLAGREHAGSEADRGIGRLAAISWRGVIRQTAWLHPRGTVAPPALLPRAKPSTWMEPAGMTRRPVPSAGSSVRPRSL
ncbi:hypothetical protein BC567DRAFT_27640 [Phyllosticta citribraziliensis]